RRHRHDLLRRDVHEVDFLGRDVIDLTGAAVRRAHGAQLKGRTLRAAAHEYALLDEAAAPVEGRVGLGDDVFLFLIGGEVHDLLRDPAVLHHAVRRLDEAVLVDAGIRGERADQADVRALGRLDRAHAAVVSGVHVAHLEPGALPAQTTRAERRQAALVRQTGEGVGLVHELGELAG